MIPNGPVVIFAFDRIFQGATLRMALNAGVAFLDIIHPRRIQGVSAGGMFHMLASRAVAPFTTNVPLSHLFGVDVIVYRVAAIARGTCWPLHIVRRIERRPPISSIGNEIWPPDAIRN